MAKYRYTVWTNGYANKYATVVTTSGGMSAARSEAIRRACASLNVSQSAVCSAVGHRLPNS